MLRKISEAVQIKGTTRENLINNKSEWNYVSLPRVHVDSHSSSNLDARDRIEAQQTRKSFSDIELDRLTVDIRYIKNFRFNLIMNRAESENKTTFALQCVQGVKLE